MNYSELDETELVEQAKIDKEAFGELYTRYVDRIYSYVYYRTSDVAEAEDLTAKIFFRAMNHIPRYTDRGLPFSAWLYRIARNLVANWHRDRNRRRIIGLDDITHWKVGQESPEIETQLLQDRDALLKVVRRLPAERQELLILKFVDRLSNTEIGVIMERSEGAIKSLYHRTLLSLREEYEKDSLNEPEENTSFFERLRFLTKRNSDNED
ncbi:MAG: RNA polymerase sigma-70 factor (ECF subfamily) [Cellvibrionaceae bacterium]|jgi:RNA polymerase sigma-70 factor (ECF subfamily)